MIERKHRYGNLVFDRDAIVRAALRAYVESVLQDIARFSFPACAYPGWTGDLKRGAFHNDNGCGDCEVVAWTEAGVVGLAYELGFGPIEQLGLSTSAVTGGPDDVRAALPGLPAKLEPALVMATGMLPIGRHGEKPAGVGFWIYGDRVGGTFFDDPTVCGADRLAIWGLLRRGRLLPPIYFRRSHPDTRATLAERDRKDAPAHAVMDAVVDRALKDPTEFTPAELETLLVPLPTPPPKRVLNAQRMLKKVGITWPGSPKIPEPPPRPQGPNPFLRPSGTVRREMLRLGYLGFDRDAIVRAAKRAYVEAVLAQLDPLERYTFTVCVIPRWTGDLKRGAFYNGNGKGDDEVIAWTEAGVVGLAYQRGYGPIEHLGLSVSAVKGSADDVRAALPDLPAELMPALEIAVGLLEVGAHGEKLASIGFWLHGADRVGGTLFDRDDPTVPGAGRLSMWGQVEWGRLAHGRHDPNAPSPTQAILDKAEPIQDLVEAVAERALAGPTELMPDELATLLPTPPDPERLLNAQRMLQKVGITWPGSPALSA
ncbi:MAG: hypothetical protein HUU21_36930 [Polyangiaceae bacterium]|nr:hypothetical protein [Polyangiaceae bacterium]NUQ79132.1 hypothetical protein [Polyangiaceae bacterium]